MMPLIISYHTPFEVYASCAKGLIESLDRLGLRHDVRCLESEGDWYQNCCQKATFVREMMDKHPGEDLIWMDADTVVGVYPELLENIEAEVACPLWRKQKVMACLIYFKNTEKVKRFVDCWIEKTYDNAYHYVCDQYGLSQALKCHRDVSFQGIARIVFLHHRA